MILKWIRSFLSKEIPTHRDPPDQERHEHAYMFRDKSNAEYHFDSEDGLTAFMNRFTHPQRFAQPASESRYEKDPAHSG